MVKINDLDLHIPQLPCCETTREVNSRPCALGREILVEESNVQG